MRQIRITSADILLAENNDCYLAPDDPIHELKKVSMLGGLGSADALARYNYLMKPTIASSDKGKIAREQHIQPGTDDWFKHWFGKTT